MCLSVCTITEKFVVAFLLNFLGSLMPGMCVPFLGRTSNKIAKDGFYSVVFILYTVSRFTSAYLHISFYCVRFSFFPVSKWLAGKNESGLIFLDHFVNYKLQSVHCLCLCVITSKWNDLLPYVHISHDSLSGSYVNIICQSPRSQGEKCLFLAESEWMELGNLYPTTWRKKSCEK